MMHFAIEQLQRVRPNWANLDAAETLMIEAGSDPIAYRRDCTDYLIVLEGSVSITAAGTPMQVATGEMTLVRAGTPYTIGPAAENTVLLRLSDAKLPPFRTAENTEGPAPVLLPPAEPLRSAQGRAIRISIEADATFSPRTIASHPHCDVVLAANPGAISLGQVREYQSVCRQNGQATAALLLDLTEREIALFFHDRTMATHTDMLNPRAIGLTTDISTAEGRKLLAFAAREWARPMHSAGIRLCANMPLRAWSDSDLRDLFAQLATFAPSAVGVMLRWDPIGLVPDFRTRAIIGAMLPWLHSIEITGEAQPQEIAHYMDGLGFQGWIIAQWNRNIPIP
jgi:mannose-6-phosphate isomerase-like protein (cupin superfamily)